ncbi:hypothetical protein [Mesorhizobium sp. 131-2-1]|uniref:hypothetical protein n=1 Tax=Mesorhizobium sp. 131-2-1 TaxID=2744518 RepID=UPI001926E172|nr:hypothetical protein [Mesorhizobium sp. 131-2-1]BCG95988.1 hypothetical protein MesoLj131a_48520 [Mesorhizobium sp. 131-2-1]
MNVSKVISSIRSKSQKERDTMRARANEALAKGSVEARQLLDALDQYEAEERQQRIDHASSLPRAQLVIEAFKGHPMTENERNVVQALLDNPGLTSTGLSDKLGWGGQIWHKNFGTLCKNRIGSLWPAPYAEERDADFYCGVLADLSADHRWTIKPEAAEGFAALGLRPAKTT